MLTPKFVIFMLVFHNNWIIPRVEAEGNPEQFETFGFDLKNDKTLGKIVEVRKL